MPTPSSSKHTAKSRYALHIPTPSISCNTSSLQGQDITSVAFLFDGTRLRPEQTPETEDMEVRQMAVCIIAVWHLYCFPTKDEDVIDVVLHQVGGTPSPHA